MFKLPKFNKKWLNKAKITLIIAILAVNTPISEAKAAWNFDGIIELVKNRPEIRQNLFLITGGDSFMGYNLPEEQKPPIRVFLTAYSSTPDQTDDTPFITASNTRVRDGIVAANFLAFGTRVQIPEIFGDKVFIVEDRMAKKNSNKIDIWFPERHSAKKFGIREADVIVLQ